MPPVNNNDDHPLSPECDHILPYFSGEVFLGHNDPDEYSWTHSMCNGIKKRGQNDDIWGWNIFSRPYIRDNGEFISWNVNVSVICFLT